MRILQISNKIPLHAKDGGAMAIHSLLQGFCKLGIEASLLCMVTPKHFMSEIDIDRLKPKNVDVHTVYLNSNINIFKLLGNLLLNRKPYILTRFISKAFGKKLMELLQSKKYDIVQLEGLYLCPYIEIIKKHSDALIAYRSHNIESEIWYKNATQDSNPLKRQYLKILAKRLLRYEKETVNKYDLLLPITTTDMNTYHKWGNAKPALTIPFGIEMKNIPDSFHKIDAPNLFFIGSLDWIPNIEGLRWFVVKVWSRIAKKNPGIKFKVAGRNANKGFINFLKKYDVLYLGEIADSKPFFLENAIMIVPLFAGSGMRVKIIEGMAYGKAIISTPLGAEGIDCENGENILIADHEDGFMEKINLLLQEKDMINKLGENAYSLVQEQYNNETIAQKLITFYKEALS